MVKRLPLDLLVALMLHHKVLQQLQVIRVHQHKALDHLDYQLDQLDRLDYQLDRLDYQLDRLDHRYLHQPLLHLLKPLALMDLVTNKYI